MFHAKYLTSSICQLLEEFFLSFYYIHIRKINDPRGGADFDPRAIIWTFLVRVYQTMPYAKYLSSRPFGSLQEGILSFYYMSYSENQRPPGRGQFWPQAYNFKFYKFFFFRLPLQPEVCLELNSLNNF
jgi:hypothetical protein